MTRKEYAMLTDIGTGGTGSIESEKDIVTRGDLIASDALREWFMELPAVLLSEELGRIVTCDNPVLTIAWDDIDGTDNYHRYHGDLPYCTVITIFDSPKPCFKDAIVAIVMSHTSGNIWHAIRGEGTFFNLRPARTSGKTRISGGQRESVNIDHYIGSHSISRLLKLYPEVWVKDFGAAAYQFAVVSSGKLDGFINLGQKGHEIGAGYLLVKEGGGEILTLEGSKLDDIEFDFNGIMSVVAGSSAQLCEEILSMLTP
jgi:myo-inositol-1(or 4)-monophosphatase